MFLAAPIAAPSSLASHFGVAQPMAARSPEEPSETVRMLAGSHHYHWSQNRGRVQEPGCSMCSHVLKLSEHRKALIILFCCCRSFYSKVDDYFPKEQVFQWDPRTNTLEELCAFLQISPCPKKGKESWPSIFWHPRMHLVQPPSGPRNFPLDTPRIDFRIQNDGICTDPIWEGVESQDPKIITLFYNEYCSFATVEKYQYASLVNHWKHIYIYIST